MGKLSDAADELAMNKISFHDATRIAETTVDGEVRNLAGGRARVRPSMATVEAELKELAVYLQSHPKEDPRKWAATFMMASAQLATGNVPSVVAMLQRAFDACGGNFSPHATNFAVATIDALLSGRTASFAWQLAPSQEQWLRNVRKTCLKS